MTSSPAVIALLAIVVAAPLAAQDAATTNDARVFQAVLGHTIRPYVVTFSNRMDTQSPTTLLVLDETVRICSAEDRSGAFCLDRRVLQSREGPSGSSMPEIPADLAQSFLARNDTSHPLPGDLAADLVSVRSNRLEETLRAWKEQAYGHLVFSHPGYAGSRAIVWAGYVCPGCGRGWVFTLHLEGDGWLVDSVDRTAPI